MEFEKLDYEYDALEPYIDKETMKIHYEKHHRGYFEKLQKALEKSDEKDVLKLLKNTNLIPENIKKSIINNGGGHINHTFFWKLLKKNVEPTEEIITKINDEFESLDNFKEEFKKTALQRFGSGWTWLVLDDENKLKIISTKNQDNPISQNLKPILGLDVWEHAYYLKYQNKRADYIDAFFNIINWKQVENNLKENLN